MPSYARETIELHGSTPDLIPEDAPATAWNASNNVFFENGETRRVPGNTPAFASSNLSVRACVFYTDAAGQHAWVYAAGGGLHAYNGSAHFTLTPTSGWNPTAESILTMIAFNGAVIVNDSVSGPFVWSGSTSVKFAPLPNWPAGWRCLSMRSHKSFLFAIGRTDTGGLQRVSWSDAAEAGMMPASWNPAADNLAGFVDVLPASSPCVDGFTLRDEFLVLKGASVWAFNFVGGNAVFAARERWRGVGLAGVNGWCLGPNDQALFFGADGDLYRTDGINYTSALDGLAQRTYLAEADPAQLRKVSAATLTRTNLSILAYATVGASACDRAIVLSWASGEVAFRDMPDVTCLAEGRYLDASAALTNAWDQAVGDWNSDNTPWNYALTPATANDVLGGSTAGFWWLTGETAASIPLAAYALKQGIAFGDPKAHKLVAWLWPKLSGTAGETVQIKVGVQEAHDAPVEWADARDFVIGAGQPVETFASGRYLALEVSSPATGGAWRLGTIDVEYRPQGLW